MQLIADGRRKNITEGISQYKQSKTFKYNTYENDIVTIAKTSKTRNTISGLLYVKTWPNFNMAVSAAMVIENCINVIVNHPHQWTPLLNPIILITFK